MGKRPPNSNGVYEFPAKKGTHSLKTIEASLSWCDAKKIIVPSTVTSIINGAFSKSNNANPNLVEIVNKTERDFNWYAITSSNKSNPGVFPDGLIKHQSGDIRVNPE